MKNNMQIQVLGSGCPTCERLYNSVKEVVVEMGLNTEVEYVTDFQKIAEMGVMSSPVLAVNGKPVMAGSVPSKDEIRELLSNGESEEEPKKCSGCTCGGNC